MGKSGPNATFDLILLGLSWPWVGEFVGFTIMFFVFPTQQKLGNRKHPYQQEYGHFRPEASLAIVPHVRLLQYQLLHGN